jgi:hypothetical protein
MGEHARALYAVSSSAREEHRKRLLEEGCNTIERLLIEKDIL